MEILVKKGSAMKGKSELTIAMATAVLAVLGAAAASAQVRRIVAGHPFFETMS